MSSGVKDQKQIRNEASKIAQKIEHSYPGTEVQVSLETIEGEDAYLWVTTSAEMINQIRVFASELAARLWESRDIVIVPRMQIRTPPDSA